MLAVNDDDKIVAMVVTPDGKSPATMKDLEALPATVKGEIIDGVLYTQPRPRAPHQSVIVAITDDVSGPFQRGRGGPGGWWILPEPGIVLPGSPEFSPDIAGWRREQMATLPERIEVAPDWACEISSPSTQRYDFVVKRPFYARIGVRFLWYVDVNARTLLVSRLADGTWSEVGVYTDTSRAKIPPFDDVELVLEPWWAAIPHVEND